MDAFVFDATETSAPETFFTDLFLPKIEQPAIGTHHGIIMDSLHNGYTVSCRGIRNGGSKAEVYIIDMDYIRSKGLPVATPVVVTNHDEFGDMEAAYGRKEHGDVAVRFHQA